MWKKVVAGTLLSVGVWTGGATASDLDIVQADQQSVEIKETKKMVSYDKDVVKRIMIQEDHFSDEDAEGLCLLLNEVDVRFQPIVDKYIKDRTISDEVNVEGLTVKILMFKQSCSFWHGLNRLNFCLSHPGLAKETLERFPFYEGQ